jgi:hypothetical protein
MDIPVAAFAPDQPPLSPSTTDNAIGVIAEDKNGYIPCKALEPTTDALTNRCQGAVSVRGSDGTIVNFAFDDAKAYKQNDAAWDDVTNSGGAYNVQPENFVNARKFGDFVIAVNGTDAPQKWELGTSVLFEDLGGSPDVGHAFVEIVEDFVVLGKPAAANNKIQWPDINNPEGWATGLADEKIFPEGGAIVGMAGGRQLYVFLENLISVGTLTGTTDVFQFSTVSSERGCAVGGSIARFQDLVFFVTYDGFYMLSPAGMTPIGEQFVDNSFWLGHPTLPGVNRDYLHRCIATCDPVHKLYRFCYPSTNSSSGACDTMLIYNWSINQWTVAPYDIDYIYRARTGFGVTLEDLDTLYPGGLETIPVSLDSFLFAGSPQESLAAFDTDKKLAFFQGPNLAATVDSIKSQIFPGKKARVKSVRPICDGDGSTVRIGVHENKLNDTVRFTDPVSQRTTGRCPFNAKRTKGRYHVARWEMPAAAVWSNFQGFDFDARQEGTR